MGERSHFDVDIDSLKAWEVLNGEIHWNGRVMKEMEESEEFEEWKQFFEGLNMEWLLENHMGTKSGTRPNDRIVYAYDGILLIVWNNITLYFDPPTWASTVKLSPIGYRELFKYVPIDVMNDFVKVLEL